MQEGKRKGKRVKEYLFMCLVFGVSILHMSSLAGKCFSIKESGQGHTREVTEFKSDLFKMRSPGHEVCEVNKFS